MSKPAKHDPAEVVNALLRLASHPREAGRGLAILRAGDSHPPGHYAPAFEYIEEHVVNASPREREAAYLVATVFAHHPLNTDAPYENFGDAARRLAAIHGSSVDRTFVGLLARPWESLPHYLPRFAARLKGDNIPIPYYRLIRDLVWWENTDTLQSPQVAWARRYYGRARQGETA